MAWRFPPPPSQLRPRRPLPALWRRAAIHSGPRSLHVQAPLDVLPLYVRANALLPTTEPAAFTAEGPFEDITVDAYLFDQGSCELYDTDGLTRLSATIAEAHLSVTLSGARQKLVLRLLPLAGGTAVEEVTVNTQRYQEVAADEDREEAGTWKRALNGTVLVYIHV